MAASNLEPQYELIEAIGNERFKISEGPIRDPSVNSFTADGTDQRANFDRTLSVMPQGENAWRVVWKMKDGARDESTWSTSADGQRLTMVGTYHDNDGKTHPIHNTYKRIAGSGLVGKWELTDSVNPAGAFPYIELRPYEKDGLSFVMRSGKVLQNIKFDGRDYPDLSTRDAVTFGSRPTTLETTDKLNGKVYDTAEYKVSLDGNTLTITDRDPGGKTMEVVVYRRVNSFPSN